MTASAVSFRAVLRSDLHRFNPATLEWTSHVPSNGGDLPPARAGHALAVLPGSGGAGDELFVFGGYSDEGALERKDCRGREYVEKGYQDIVGYLAPDKLFVFGG